MDETYTMRDILDAVAQGRDLTPGEADYAFAELYDGNLSPAQAGGLLLGLRAKGETALEITAAAKAGVARARLVEGLPRDAALLDIVGTGGDRTSSFNCSTATSLYLAALGHRVVKHGNRAVSSSCGSADALEGLGLPLGTPPEEVPAELARTGFVFLFAPNYHPAFAHIAPVRRELGIRTLFNLLGPLLNPARPSHQVLGVGHGKSLPLMAEALGLTDPGVTAFVFHGAGGFDELTTFGPAEVYLVQDGKRQAARIDPRELGFAMHAPDDVRVTDKACAIKALRGVLCGTGPVAMMDMTALNLAASLHLVTGKALAECAREAKTALADGAARRFAEGFPEKGPSHA